ncbi:DNA/RNA-binding protein Alba 2 [uncultured archaeon]|nr:DNA/RNA-binding protein Alba 2 [uncultured archaeon]
MEQPTIEPISQKERAIPQAAQPKPAAGPAPAAMKDKKPESPRQDDNVVYIGKKDVMGYVLAVVTNFNRGSTEVVIKARGQLISRAVDVEEIVKRRFLPNVKIKGIRVMTEDLQNRTGQQSNVSAIEIILSK